MQGVINSARSHKLVVAAFSHVRATPGKSAGF